MSPRTYRLLYALLFCVLGANIFAAQVRRAAPVENVADNMLVDALCFLAPNVWSAECLNESSVARVHAPRHTAARTGPQQRCRAQRSPSWRLIDRPE
jgi:hypothetical protein